MTNPRMSDALARKVLLGYDDDTANTDALEAIDAAMKDLTAALDAMADAAPTAATIATLEAVLTLTHRLEAKNLEALQPAPSDENGENTSPQG